MKVSMLCMPLTDFEQIPENAKLNGSLDLAYEANSHNTWIDEFIKTSQSLHFVFYFGISNV